jgi:hypothetical protein
MSTVHWDLGQYIGMGRRLAFGMTSGVGKRL